jgi:monoamine oxidase
VTLVLNPPTTVAVIGAGIAGLAAAHRLRGAGAEVVVYEARQRVGGRTHSVTDGFHAGQHADLGAELVASGYRVFEQLCGEVGVQLSELVSYEREGSVQTALEGYLEAGRLMIGGDLLDAEAFDTVVRELRAALEATPAAPHEVLAQWVRRARLSRTARGAVTAVARMLTQADLHQLDGERYLFSGSPMGGARRVVGGTDRLACALAENLDVRLATPVRTIRQGGGVAVTTENGQTERFDRAIVTAPFHVLATIGFDPPLEPQRLAALNAFEPTVGGKLVAQYAEGNAVRQALTRACLTDGPINTIWVANPYITEGPAVVSGFVCGVDRTLLESPDDGLALLDDLVARAVKGAVTRIASVTKDWTADRWALAVTTTPGQDQCAELVSRTARPQARLHFAGDYTDVGWCGTMEGAVRSGQRAADEILRRPTRIPLPEIDVRLVRQ